jgi:hypothetical protein
MLVLPKICWQSESTHLGFDIKEQAECNEEELTIHDFVTV